MTAANVLLIDTDLRVRTLTLNRPQARNALSARLRDEFFTALGQEIKRRSPFRYTYVFELANDYIGYIPDRRGFDHGGYQVWTG